MTSDDLTFETVKSDKELKGLPIITDKEFSKMRDAFRSKENGEPKGFDYRGYIGLYLDDGELFHSYYGEVWGADNIRGGIQTRMVGDAGDDARNDVQAAERYALRLKQNSSCTPTRLGS